MNTTIDFKTAKTIENMSRKIDGMERAVFGFFNKMSDIAERKYGDPQVYLAAVGPARDLSAILLEEAPGILPCFDETDDTFGISKELPVAGCYNPKQVLELSGKRYLTGPVVSMMRAFAPSALLPLSFRVSRILRLSSIRLEINAT